MKKVLFRKSLSWRSWTFFGGVGQYAVIFTTDGVESGDLADLGWLQQFPRGYGVGKGIEIPDNNFDDFEPVEPSTVEIIVGDLGDIEFVNWH